VEDESPLLYVHSLANAGSLFLPGSKSDDLIVLGHSHLSGTAFLARMWAPGLSALVVTAIVVAAFRGDALKKNAATTRQPPAPFLGLGLIA